MNNWKLNVAPIPGSLSVAVTLYRVNNTQIRNVEVLRFGADGQSLIEGYESVGASIKPSFEIHGQDFNGVLAAFTEHSRTMGFKEATEASCEGKLAAMELHLEDMRHIVFKKNPLEIINVMEHHHD